MKWLIYGAFSSVLFALWGLFAKLSSFQNPIISNFILASGAFLTAVAVLLATNRRLIFSKFAIIAGFFGGIQSIIILLLLLKNQLILVLPFTSIAGVIFFLIVYFTERPSYNIKQKILAGTGMFFSLVGLFLIATGSVGFVNFFMQISVDATYIFFGILIGVTAAISTYFGYRSTKFEKIDAATYVFWNLVASLVPAIIALLVFNPSAILQLFSLSSAGYYYPTLGGICVSFGIFFMYKAFRKTTTKTKLQEAIIGILSNGELIALPFLSYFILGESVVQGYIGVAVVLIGLSLINYSEVMG